MTTNPNAPIENAPPAGPRLADVTTREGAIELARQKLVEGYKATHNGEEPGTMELTAISQVATVVGEDLFTNREADKAKIAELGSKDAREAGGAINQLVAQRVRELRPKIAATTTLSAASRLPTVVGGIDLENTLTQMTGVDPAGNLVKGADGKLAPGLYSELHTLYGGEWSVQRAASLARLEETKQQVVASLGSSVAGTSATMTDAAPAAAQTPAEQSAATGAAPLPPAGTGTGTGAGTGAATPTPPPPASGAPAAAPAAEALDPTVGQTTVAAPAAAPAASTEGGGFMETISELFGSFSDTMKKGVGSISPMVLGIGLIGLAAAFMMEFSWPVLALAMVAIVGMIAASGAGLFGGGSVSAESSLGGREKEGQGKELQRKRDGSEQPFMDTASVTRTQDQNRDVADVRDDEVGNLPPPQKQALGPLVREAYGRMSS